MAIYAVAVPKGGTGKTTTTLNLGAALGERGKRVLLVDFDPQGNLTQALGVRPGQLQTTVYDVIKHYTTTFESELESIIHKTSAGVDLVPASARLNLANDELATAIQREFVLSNLLAPVLSQYDFILIDTLPYLGILVVNALVAASKVLVPLQPEYLATESMQLLFSQVAMMRRSRLNPTLEIGGILLTMVDERTIIHREAVSYIQGLSNQVPRGLDSKIRVFNTKVKRTIRFVESQARHQSILEYDSKSEAAQSYRALAEEILQRGA